METNHSNQDKKEWKMEIAPQTQVQDHEPPIKKKGGFATLPFILVTESLEKVTTQALRSYMLAYFYRYGISQSKAESLLNVWRGGLNLTPIIGALLADSFAGRFLTIGIGSIISLSGMLILWMTTVIPTAKPPPCILLPPKTCQSPSIGQYVFLTLPFILMSIGAGGVRSSSQSFGVNQIDNQESPNKKRIVETFFNWYYALNGFSNAVVAAVTAYISVVSGVRVGFEVLVFLMILSVMSFFIPSRRYVKVKPRKCGLLQVIVASIRNRKAHVSTRSYVLYFQRRNSPPLIPSDTLRFLNRACIIKSAEQDMSVEELSKRRWTLCPVEDVEALKSLIKVMPIWFSGIICSIISVNSFPPQQAATMDKIGKFGAPNFLFGAFSVSTTVAIWTVLYEHGLIPLATKICRKPVKLSVKMRMGFGLLFYTMSMMTAGLVEHIRRKKVNGNHNWEHIQLSSMLLFAQYVLLGFAEAFHGVAEIEFYYSELPKNISSIATTLQGVSIAIAYFVTSLISGWAKGGWMTDNMNLGHYDYYYWVLAVVSCLNIPYFMYCSKVYVPVAIQRLNDAEIREQELVRIDQLSGSRTMQE